MTTNGVRTIQGVNILPLDGLWRSVKEASVEDKLAQALEFAGCEFYDDQRRIVTRGMVALCGMGGIPIAHESESDYEIEKRLTGFMAGSREMMASSAALSYLNSSEKSLPDLYSTVTTLGHFSIAHTVQANFMVAGISQAGELELNLQRDIVHISKVTNTRTKIQNSPPLVLGRSQDADMLLGIHEHIAQQAAELRAEDGSMDALELANGLFPVNKATLLMVSGSIKNLKKLANLKDDTGKELELRKVANGLYRQLSLIWPEIMIGKE